MEKRIPKINFINSYADRLIANKHPAAKDINVRKISYFGLHFVLDQNPYFPDENTSFPTGFFWDIGVKNLFIHSSFRKY